MKKLILLEALVLLIPTILAANINVDIVIAKNDAERHTHATGSDERVINNLELETFQLYNGKLKDAMKAYYGKRPDDVFLKSRTPWGDLYRTYNWPQVHRILNTDKTEILTVEYDTMEVMTQYINNTDNKDVIKKVALRKELENTVESNWQNNTTLIGIDVQYDIVFKTDYGETTLHYDSAFGESVKKTEKVVIGPKNDVEVTLKPGQRAKAVLKANIGILKVSIDYVASLNGHLTFNYGTPYKGHHYYGLDINVVIGAIGLNGTAVIREILTVTYYPEYKIVVQDVDTKEILKS